MRDIPGIEPPLSVRAASADRESAGASNDDTSRAAAACSRRGLVDARRRTAYERCLLTSLVISNMLTLALPPKTGLSVASDLMTRLFFASWSLFFLM